jgi:single-strand DNA-binding protein
LNVITVAGNLGRDAELRYTSNGEAYANFSIADSPGKDKPTIWWRCKLWGKPAESLSPYLIKGTMVTVTGPGTEITWTDKGGQERTSLEINVSDIAVQGGSEEPWTSPQASGEKQRRNEVEEVKISADDIPF